jgi:isopentenyl diphosphate isomerase/L-lactate dehydrogenase-like FMN-dependent dehydrogenase
MFDPTVDFDDLRWIKEQWPGAFVVKGVQTLDDAKRVAEIGVDGIVLSNHGGRQLDRAPSRSTSCPRWCASRPRHRDPRRHRHHVGR